MKKTTILGLAGMMLTAATLQAQVNIYITGSTSFRANTIRGVTSLYDGGTPTEAFNGNADHTKANFNTFSGTISNLFGVGTIVNTYCSWGGSIQGIQTLTQNIPIRYLASATNNSIFTTNSANGADIALSDAFQSSSGFTSPTLRDSVFAVIPFVYVKGIGSPATLTNITSQQLLSLLPNGNIALSVFTGNTNDDATLVYWIGRSTDSGTRVTSEYDSLFQPSTFVEVPFTTISNCVWFPWAGFGSGSGVAGFLNTNTCAPTIGPLGMSDSTSVNGGNNIITYNGQLPFKGTFNTSLTQTNDFTPVIKGQYSYWGYEHIFERTSEPVNGNVDKFRTAVAAKIDADIADTQHFAKLAVRLSEMKVSRAGDGAPIGP
jgi:hypothetical protein